MKLGFLELPAIERRLYFEQAAIQRNLSPVILEKDFWVCWLLGILFESDFAENLVFKGGTSLSKVFGVIERFSEDIDLSLSPTFLNLPEAGTSRNQANKWMTKAEAAEKKTPDRFSRHYADTAAMAKHPAASKAIDQHDFRRRVVSWKSQFFGSSWANYDLAKPGTFRMVPPIERLAALRNDYQAMRDMYLSDPINFDDILATLANLENRINAVSE